MSLFFLFFIAYFVLVVFFHLSFEFGYAVSCLKSLIFKETCYLSKGSLIMMVMILYSILFSCVENVMDISSTAVAQMNVS